MAEEITPEKEPIIDPELPGDGSALEPGASPAKPDDGLAKEFIPGKYKTVEDAVKNQDNRMGGLAQQLGDIKRQNEELRETISKLVPGKGSTVVDPQNINPETGQPFTKAEVTDAWIEAFQRDPVAALAEWNDKVVKPSMEAQALEIESRVTKKVSGKLVWDAFVGANPEMKSLENIKLLQQILADFPFLDRESDGLNKAREIILSQGETVVEKYNNWVKGIKPAEPKPAPAAMPGQGAINRGSPGKPDAFSKWGLMGK